MRFLTREEVAAWPPDAPLEAGETELARARRAVDDVGLAGPRQQMGMRWSVGCVALEITQRCNLDCTLCYLSEHSEAVHDLPLVEVFRRIDAIRARYGPNTDVQVTGGDPTLRKRDELIAIVARVRERGLRPTLMTNGIKADASLLAALADAGLVDVVFHVDTTQDRSGYDTERSLEPLRERYIANARAAGLSVMFNTTVHAGNFHELPYLVRYFTSRARHIRTCGFQLQADTGRGVMGAREQHIDIETVTARIEEGAGAPLDFEGSIIGHPRCSRTTLCAVVGDQVYDLLDDRALVARILPATTQLVMRRDRPLRSLADFVGWLARHPSHCAATLRWLGRKLWSARGSLVRSRGRLSTITFTVHNFMDARQLECDRLKACVFKVMTGDGPVSMCLHNAKRDAFILKPLALAETERSAYWQPLTGQTVPSPTEVVHLDPAAHPLKRLKGRSRQHALAARKEGRRVPGR